MAEPSALPAPHHPAGSASPWVVRFATPDHYDAPSKRLEIDPIPDIPRFVAGELLEPIIWIGLRDACPCAAIVVVPKASVDENDSRVPGQNNIWCAGQVFSMETVPKSKSVERATNNHFGAGTFAPNRPHHLAAIHPKVLPSKASVKATLNNRPEDCVRKSIEPRGRP